LFGDKRTVGIVPEWTDAFRQKKQNQPCIGHNCMSQGYEFEDSDSVASMLHVSGWKEYVQSGEKYNTILMKTYSQDVDLAQLVRCHSVLHVS
jgi:hypothetical protein